MEDSAILAVGKIIVGKNVHKRKITILFDSRQAAVKALDPKVINSSVINSKMVYDCSRCLNEVANRY